LAERTLRLQRKGEVGLSALPPLALYVHLPWCLKKCPYCDFNSHAWSGGDVLPERQYLQALRADLEAALPQVWSRRVASVFVGGGTPSLFSSASIEALIADIRARLPLEPLCEITLEANPGTFERERFRAFRGAGVTRLSIGVQSFDDGCLRRIGRVHDAAQARAAVEEARSAFDTFNIDLMYALPGQSPAMLAADLDAALGFEPPHLSVYHLTIEANTAFAVQPPAGLPDEDGAAAMLDLIGQRCAAAGLERYEVSAYARRGHRCRHNLNYWRFGDYLGIGAGAHSKLSFPDRIVRQVRWREPRSYIERALAGAAVSNEHPIAAADLPFEFMLNALRLRDGFQLDWFAERTGLGLHAIAAPLEAAIARGLIARDGERHLRPTERGFDFLSDLQQLFLPPA
jgi:oxygen-independent coproporphyrinogen-3 oxidase